MMSTLFLTVFAVSCILMWIAWFNVFLMEPLGSLTLLPFPLFLTYCAKLVVVG